jgi:hypothetical protein
MASLTDELAQIADVPLKPDPKDNEFQRYRKCQARERLIRLVEYAAEHLKHEIKLPSIKDTKYELIQVQKDIKRLKNRLRRISEVDLIQLHQLKHTNWSHVRHLDLTIWHLQDALDNLARTLNHNLERLNKLDGQKHKHRKHNVHDVLLSCDLFFMEFSRHKATSGPTSRFSEFVRTLFRELGHHRTDVTWIISAYVSETAQRERRRKQLQANQRPK